MKAVDPIDLLRQTALLRGIDASILGALIEQSRMETAPAGTILFHQDEPGDCAYVIASGQLEVLVETALGTMAMAVLGPHDIVGETGVFTNMPRTATARTLTETTLLRLPRSALHAVIANDPEAAAAIIGVLGRRVNALNRPLAMLSLASEALERDRLDTRILDALADEASEVGPFAKSLTRILREMEWKETRRQEMAVAARIQQSILPKALDPGGGFAVDAIMHPAREVGGDFYDFFLLEGGRKLVVLVGDVAGKGVPAAMVMAMTRAVLRSMVPTVRPLETSLKRVNEGLAEDNAECIFVTLFIAELDLATGELLYCNAGHTDALLVDAEGRSERLSANTAALGLMPGLDFPTGRTTLGPGQTLLVSSDGISEAFNPEDEQFGDERFRETAARLAGMDAKRIVGEIVAKVNAFSAGCEQSDDITCLALTRRG